MKLIALVEGLRLVKIHNLTPIHINVDSKIVINMINNGNLQYDGLIEECRSLLAELGHLEVEHNYREQNRVADALAKKGARRKQYESMPVFAVSPM